MKNNTLLYVFEALMVVLLILFIYPFVIVVLGSAKDASV